MKNSNANTESFLAQFSKSSANDDVYAQDTQCECDDNSDAQPLSSMDDIDDMMKLQNYKLRQKFAAEAILITRVWIGFILVAFVISGICNICKSGACFSDIVLISLIAGTSLGVVISLTSKIIQNIFMNDK